MYYLNKYHSLIPYGRSMRSILYTKVSRVNNKLPQGGYGVCTRMVCKKFSFSNFATPHFCKAQVGGPTRLALRSETHQKQASSNWMFSLMPKKNKMLCSASKQGKITDALASDSAKQVGNALHTGGVGPQAGNSLNVIRKIVHLKTKHLNNPDALQNQEKLSKLNPTKIFKSSFKKSDYSRNTIHKGKIESHQLQDNTTSDALNISGTSTVTETSASKLKVFFNKSYNKHLNHIHNQSMDLQTTSSAKVAIKMETKGFSRFFGLKQTNLSNKSWMLKNKQKTLADLSFAKVKNHLTKESLYKSFNNPNTRYSKMMEISLITISLASANRIRQWAEKTLPNGKVVGEVINPETVHYKTLKPIKGGLFCERIFGPLKDYECACGKKFNIKQYLTTLSIMQSILDTKVSRSKTLQKRYFCRVCDVEYTYSLIRRTQLGYIALATPTTHVWFVKGLPSYISILLDMKKTHLQNVIYNIRTLTLEHAFRGPRNMPTSPSLIYETWQKIMQAQYPDKYGPSKENLLTTDLKKQSGNITPVLLKNQKTILKPAPTKKQANRNSISSESNPKKITVFNLRSNKLTPQEIKKTNLCYLATQYTTQTQSKQKNLILLSAKKIKQIYKENKKKYSRSLNLYHLYDNKSFKKTCWIKVYSLFSVKSCNKLQPISFSSENTEQDALSQDRAEHDLMREHQDKTIFLTKSLLFNKVLADYAENQKVQNIHILPWWTKLLNDKDKSIVNNRMFLPVFTFCNFLTKSCNASINMEPQVNQKYKLGKNKHVLMLCLHKFGYAKHNPNLYSILYTKVSSTSWFDLCTTSKYAKHHTGGEYQNHLLISNLVNTCLQKFWAFFEKMNQKTIYAVFGHDWFEFKGNMIKMTNSARTQGQFGHLTNPQVLTTLHDKLGEYPICLMREHHVEPLIGLLTLTKAQFFTTSFLNKLLIYTSQSRLVAFNNKTTIYSTNYAKHTGGECPQVILKQDNNRLIPSCDLLLTKLNNFETHTTKLAIMFLLNIKTKLTTGGPMPPVCKALHKTKYTNQITNTKLKPNSLLRSMVWFSQQPRPKPAGASSLGCKACSRATCFAGPKSKNNIKPIKEKKIKFFNICTNIVKGKIVQRLFTYYQTSNNQKQIVSFAPSTVEAMLGFDTSHFPSKVLANKTQALQTFKTSKSLTHYFFFLKARFKTITSTIYNSLLNDIQKSCASLVKHQRLAISEFNIASEFPIQNNVLTYFFVLKSFFQFMTNAKHSFDINFRIKKISKRYMITESKQGSGGFMQSIKPYTASSVSLALQLNTKPLLVNNIYCLSHRELWEQEKDWQDFAYYYYPSNWLVENILKSSKNKISIETSDARASRILPDLFIPFYKHRNYEILFKFDNRFTYTDLNYFTENFQNYSLGMNINTAFSGAGLIQKLLNDFDFSELKKLDKQNRILLFEYNKYIKNLKTKLALEMKVSAKNKSNDKLENKLKRIYSKACQIRDALIRRTKLTRKIYNFIDDTNQKLDNNQQGTKDSNLVTRSESVLQTQLSKHGTEKEQITNGLNMILTLLPVLPPVLRPVLKMSGQFTVSDLNRLYQRIIYRNERLKKFLQDPALNSSFEMKYAQRLVQEAVDNLIQNGKSGVVPEKDTRGRLLKSLSDILKGKQGRFRQYLLGKRVDYSGRSVIVVGPRLKLHECGIPKEMAVVLYSPFLIKRILNEKIADTYLAAKKIIKTNPLLVSQLLREIMKSCPVLLNRAPTLHRLGFQAFQPKLVDGKAILLHPLVCPAFNADFDGDQMAVHVPITFEARAEAWKLMLARNNLLSPATGDPLILPSQDMVLGCYYLTFLPTWGHSPPVCEALQNLNTSVISKKVSGLFFHNINSVLKAYNQQLLHTHNIIWVKIQADIENGTILEQPLEIRLPLAHYKLAPNPEYVLINSTTQTSKNPYYNLNYIEIYSRSHNFLTIKGTLRSQIIRTTPGKILFNMLIKKALEKKTYLTI